MPHRSSYEFEYFPVVFSGALFHQTLMSGNRHPPPNRAPLAPRPRCTRHHTACRGRPPPQRAPLASCPSGPPSPPPNRAPLARRSQSSRCSPHRLLSRSPGRFARHNVGMLHATADYKSRRMLRWKLHCPLEIRQTIRLLDATVQQCWLRTVAQGVEGAKKRGNVWCGRSVVLEDANRMASRTAVCVCVDRVNCNTGAFHTSFPPYHRTQHSPHFAYSIRPITTHTGREVHTCERT